MAQTATQVEQPNWQSGANSIAARARHRAESAASAVAMRQKELGIWRETTWSELWEQVELAANGLLSLGVEPGDRVSIQAENRGEWVILDLAVVAARGVIVGLNPGITQHEVERTLDDCRPVVHLADDQEQVDKVVELPDNTCRSVTRVVHVEQRGFDGYTDPRLISWGDFLDLGRGFRGDNPAALDARMAAAAADDAATIAYTAGTSEEPKGAMLTNANCDFAIDTLIMNPARLPGGKLPNERDEIVSFLPLCDIAERALSTWHLVAAGSVVNFSEHANEVTAALREVQPTLFFADPGIWERMLGGVKLRAADASRFKRFVLNRAMKVAGQIGRARVDNLGKWNAATRVAYGIARPLAFGPLREELGLRHCRYAVSGTAPIAPEVLEFFMGIGLDIHEMYGITESTGVATGNLAGRVRVGTIGEPYPDVLDSVRLDAETSEIQINHAGVFAGYWDDEAHTAEAFTDDGWLRTGDVGELVDESHIRFVERTQHVLITTDGRTVFPSGIENSLKTSPFIGEAMIIGYGKEFLTALISIESETAATWARKRGLSYTSFRDLTNKQELVQLIRDAVDETNAKFAEADQIKDFRIFPKELDHEDGELTATYKLRRSAIKHQHAQLVESMY
ncbi:MAG: long-chain fatty acid--CoA ligase [Ilumatobacter sp.]